MILPELDFEAVEATIEGFVREQVESTGHRGVVLGVSGGLDSAVALVLCVRALGPEAVTAFFMPTASTSRRSGKDAAELARCLDVELVVVDIDPQLDAYFGRFTDADDVRRGNKAARERMAILYDQAKAREALVCGTSNKSEILLGYGTVHGDAAWSFGPIADLYKTELKRMGPFLGVADKIVGRAPSAELWPGQTDEGELGYTYEELDLLLWAMFDRGMDSQELTEGGFTPEMIEAVGQRVRRNAFKRELPPICRVH